jgi:hypothetical protein
MPRQYSFTQAYGGEGFASKLSRYIVVMTELDWVRSLDKAAEDIAFPGFVVIVINCLQFFSQRTITCSTSGFPKMPY